MTDSWIVLRCSGRSTLRLAETLTQDGFSCWSPIERVRERGRRGKQSVPLLPTFVFASACHLWSLVALSEDPMSRHDGFSVMRHGCGLGYPIIRDSELDAVRKEERDLLDAAHRAALKAAPPKVEKGDEVRCPEAGFDGMTGIVESADKKFAWVRFPGAIRPAKIATYLLQPDQRKAA